MRDPVVDFWRMRAAKAVPKEKPVGPFWRYYGGKWRAAPRYPAPECGTIIEPFAGAAGYACRYPGRRVILVDASPIIAGIWRYLIGASSAEILAIPDIPEGGTVDDLPVCQEARWLAGFWCNDATVVPSKSPSAWVRKNQKERPNAISGWGAKARDRISRDVERIRHWQIIEGEYTMTPNVVGTLFIDPPYQTKAGGFYPYQPDSFAALGKWVLSRQGQIIACDQHGADWLPWNSEIHILAAPGAKRDGSSAEVVYHRSLFSQPRVLQERL